MKTLPPLAAGFVWIICTAFVGAPTGSMQLQGAVEPPRPRAAAGVPDQDSGSQQDPQAGDAAPAADDEKPEQANPWQEQRSRRSRNWLSSAFGSRSNSVNQRDHASILAAFRPVVADSVPATVRIFAGEEPCALGAIVDGQGFVLTKASEVMKDLEQDIYCELVDGRRLEGELVGLVAEHDLALLKISASDLPAVTFDADAQLAPGSWIVTPGLDQDPLALGIVSVSPRWIRGGVLGIHLEPTDQGPRIVAVSPKGGGSKAGIKTGDIIQKVNGKQVIDIDAAVMAIGSYPPGDKVRVGVLRGDEELELEAQLDDLHSAFGNRRAMFQNNLGTRLSERRAGFPLALEHDSGLDPNQCGGPLVDLSGRVVGINIARQGRVSSFAIPASVIVPLLPDLKAGKYAPGLELQVAKARERLEEQVATLAGRVVQLEAALEKSRKTLAATRASLEGAELNEGLQQALIRDAQAERTASDRLAAAKQELHDVQARLESLSKEHAVVNTTGQ